MQGQSSIFFCSAFLCKRVFSLLFQQIVHVTVEPISFSLVSIQGSVNIINQIILRVKFGLQSNAEVFQAAKTVGHLVQVGIDLFLPGSRSFLLCSSRHVIDGAENKLRNGFFLYTYLELVGRVDSGAEVCGILEAELVFFAFFLSPSLTFGPNHF